MNVEVSVICSAYNHEKYIKECLDGFVKQKTSFRFEVLVHDDASTDKTADIVMEYAKKYPSIFVPVFETENQYSRGNRFVEKMMETARGNYVAICEGDDFWIDEYKLQKQYDAMANNPSVSLVVGKVICCMEDGSPSDTVFPPREYDLSQSGIVGKEKLKNIIFWGYPFQTSSYFAKKTLIQKSNTRTFGQYMNGDQRIIREAIIEGDFYYINETLSCYRLNSIGGWNQRISREASQKRALHLLKMIYGHIDFDRITNSVYSAQIRTHIIKTIGPLGYADKQMFNEIRRYFKIKGLDVLRYAGRKSYIGFVLTIISPRIAKSFFALMRRIKH